jgi:hypothetical protein
VFITRRIWLPNDDGTFKFRSANNLGGTQYYTDWRDEKETVNLRSRLKINSSREYIIAIDKKRDFRIQTHSYIFNGVDTDYKELTEVIYS